MPRCTSQWSSGEPRCTVAKLWLVQASTLLFEFRLQHRHRQVVEGLIVLYRAGGGGASGLSRTRAAHHVSCRSVAHAIASGTSPRAYEIVYAFG